MNDLFEGKADKDSVAVLLEGKADRTSLDAKAEVQVMQDIQSFFQSKIMELEAITRCATFILILLILILILIDNFFFFFIAAPTFFSFYDFSLFACAENV